MATISTPRQRAPTAAFYAVIMALAAVGALSVVHRWTEGLKVTDLTSTMTWGLWISLYIFFVGLSAGSFLLSTLIFVFGFRDLERVGRLAILSAILSMTAAMLFVWVVPSLPD